MGFMFAAHSFIPAKFSVDFYEWWQTWSKAISPFAVILGIMSLFMVHGTKIQRKAPNWQYSVVTLFGLGFTAFAGFMWGTNAAYWNLTGFPGGKSLYPTTRHAPWQSMKPGPFISAVKMRSGS